MKRYFEFIAGRSSKFWNISVDDRVTTRHWGRIGTDGSVTADTFGTHHAAMEYATRIIQEKLLKGYEEVNGPPSPRFPSSAKKISPPGPDRDTIVSGLLALSRDLAPEPDAAESAPPSGETDFDPQKAAAELAVLLTSPNSIPLTGDTPNEK